MKVHLQETICFFHSLRKIGCLETGSVKSQSSITCMGTDENVMLLVLCNWEHLICLQSDKPSSEWLPQKSVSQHFIVTPVTEQAVISVRSSSNKYFCVCTKDVSWFLVCYQAFMPPVFSEATRLLLFLIEAQPFGQIFHLLATMAKWGQ